MGKDTELKPCMGMNCGCTDWVSHSLECQAEHAAAIAGGVLLPTADLLAKDARIAELEAQLTATPSEDGREVPEVIAWRVLAKHPGRIREKSAAFTVERQADSAGADWAIDDWRVSIEPLMTVAQHERIVAAKDAEIARLKADDAEAIKRPPYAHICIGMPAALHHDTRKLLERFTHALAMKLRAAEQKYGYSNGWKDAGWMDECRAKLAEHMAKGDPRDVAAYCAFLWHHGEGTVQPARQVGGDADLDAAMSAEFGDSGNSAQRIAFAAGWYARAALAPATTSYQFDGQVVRTKDGQYVCEVIAFTPELMDDLLAPAAVVMPERSTWRADGGHEAYNDALDAVARLNRNAIPGELLRQLRDEFKTKDMDGLHFQCFHCASDDSAGEIEHDADCPITQLRALLGKEG